MAFTVDDIMSQLGSLFGGSGSGATAFAAPNTTNGMQAAGGLLPQNTVRNWGAPQAFNAGANNGLGFNLGTGQLALGGLSALTGLMQGNKAMGLARDQFDFTKNLANTNLTNQVQSYNTSLADRLNARGVAQGQSAADIQAAIDANRLSR